MQILDYFKLPLIELVKMANLIQLKHPKGNMLEKAFIINVKKGGCLENCHFCAQSSSYQKFSPSSILVNEDEDKDIMELVDKAIQCGADRVCLVGAWSEAPRGKKLDHLLELTKRISQRNLQVCCCFGFLTLEQAKEIKAAGAYAYNHNLQTARSFYPKIVSTHNYDRRIDTVTYAGLAGLQVCSGVILGMGETIEHRAEVLAAFIELIHPPESLTVNLLVPISGTPLEKQPQLDYFEVLQFIAVARILFPKIQIRLSAGRKNLSEAEQFLALLTGANSFFVGDELLVTSNIEKSRDEVFFHKVGIL